VNIHAPVARLLPSPCHKPIEIALKSSKGNENFLQKLLRIACTFPFKSALLAYFAAIFKFQFLPCATSNQTWGKMCFKKALVGMNENKLSRKTESEEQTDRKRAVDCLCARKPSPCASIYI
jgi:hypothetical protein